MTACGIQNPRVVLAPPPTTLLRGRTEPEDEGRAEGETLLLLVVVAGCAPPDGLPADEGLPLEEGLPLVAGLELTDGVPPEEGLVPEEGLALVVGELADGLSVTGGTLACATGAPPPPELL